MSCRHRVCLRLFVSAALLVVVHGCSGGKEDEPPVLGSPDRVEDDPLGTFLRNPPRLPSEVQRVVAREWRRRMQADGELGAYRDRLNALDKQLRAEGLLLNDAELAAVTWHNGRLIPATVSAGDASAREFNAWFVDGAQRRARPAVARALHTSRQQLARVRREIEALAVESLMRRAELDRENRFDKALNQFDAIDGLDILLTKQGASELKQAHADWSSIQTDYERAASNDEPLDELRERTRQAKERVAAVQRNAMVTWRDLFLATDPTWEQLTADWNRLALRLANDVGKRPVRIGVLVAAAERMQEQQDEVTEDTLVRLSREAAQLEAGIESYANHTNVQQAESSEAAGVLDALELAMRALERLDQRRWAAELILMAQSVSTFDADKLRAVVQSRDTTWGDVVAAASVDVAEFEEPPQAARLLNPFFTSELSQAVERNSTQNQSVATAARRQAAELRSRIGRLNQQAVVSAEAISDGVSEARKDVEAVLNAEANDSTARLRMEIARDLMHNSEAIGERIAAIEAREPLYEPLSDEARSEILVALERHERRDGDTDDDDPQTETSQQKWGERIAHSEEAIKAAKDVTELLVALDVVPVEDANKVLRGLDAASASLTIATGLMSGNVFDVISGSAQLISIITGREPPPSIEQLRHEQVMEALTALGEGQQAIFAQLGVILDKIEGLNTQFDELQRIVVATHRLVVDDQLQGLRLAQDFVEARRFYAEPSGEATPASSAMVPKDYEQWTAHFRQNRHAYREGRRFLDDQVRETPRELLRLATEMTGDSADLRGLPPGWSKRLQQDEERIAALKAFAKWIDPRLRQIVLGSMAYPATNMAALERKLELISAQDERAVGIWRSAWLDAGLKESLWKRFNPLLLTEISEVLVAIQPYRLIDQGEDFSGRMPSFEELTAPGFDPSQPFGASLQGRNAQLTRPLRDAERLLMQATAQDSLIQGDVLLPVLALLAMSDSLRCDNVQVQHAAERVLVSDPTLRHNALRFLVYLNLHHDDDERERIVAQALSLLNSEAHEGIRPVWIAKTQDLFDLRDRYRQLVRQPLPVTGGWPLLGKRLPSEQSMRYLLLAVDRQGYNSWGQTVYDLDLKVTNPMSHDDEVRGPQTPEERLGSPAMVVWWHDLGKREGVQTLWAERLRLPSESDVQSGALLRSHLSEPLADTLAIVRESREELVSVYGAESRTASGNRRLREGWLRMLCDEAMQPSNSSGSHRSRPVMTDAIPPGGAAGRQ